MQGRLHVHGDPVAQIDRIVPVDDAGASPGTAPFRIVSLPSGVTMCGRKRCHSRADGAHVHVVVVIVGDEHGVDPRAGRRKRCPAD